MDSEDQRKLCSKRLLQQILHKLQYALQQIDDRRAQADSAAPFRKSLHNKSSQDLMEAEARQSSACQAVPKKNSWCLHFLSGEFD